MADIRETFPVLEDAAGEGAALRQVQVGDALAGKSGLIALGFKDVAGNAALPTVNADGTLAVSSGAAGTVVHARGENAGSLAPVDIATITLTASASYQEIRMNVSCFREAVFELVQVDGATETVLDDILVGAGEYTDRIDLSEYIITAGATGTQSLKIRATNLQKASTMRGRVIATELA